MHIANTAIKPQVKGKEGIFVKKLYLIMVKKLVNLSYIRPNIAYVVSVADQIYAFPP